LNAQVGDPALINLPAPYSTKSTVNFSKVLGWKNNAKPVAPKGFRVSKFASGLQNPRWIYVLPNGDILVAETKKTEKGIKKIVSDVSGASKSKGASDNLNRISLFRDSNKDGKPDLQKTFISGLNMPFGMLLLNHYIYVANTDALWRYPYKDGATGITVTGEKITEYPSEGRHWTRNIVANAEGTKIYIAIGSGSDHAENGIDYEKDRACIIEINPDGSGRRIYASGLRNPVGMDWMPGTKILWTAVNERDELGDDVPPDYLTHVEENGFYGWPYSYWGKHEDPRIEEKDKKPELVASAKLPDVALGTHTASLGLVFYDGKMFPEKYHGGAFVGQHGSWNRSIPSGYKVVFVPFKNKIAEPIENFLTGFMADANKNTVYGRPVGVAIMKDGSLLVADDAGNSVWRVSYGK
jgi:glucose/arabinose dehydrogenase